MGIMAEKDCEEEGVRVILDCSDDGYCMEKQYYVYKIYFVLDTSLDSEKLLELYKNQISKDEKK